MSQNVLNDAAQVPSSPPSPSNPPQPHLQDFTALASALQNIAQALLTYSQPGQANTDQSNTGQCSTPAPKQAIPRQQEREEKEEKGKQHERVGQQLDTPSSFPSSPYLSKRVKKKDRFKALDLNIDISAFVDKSLAKSFDEGYRNGFFRDEIRYYYMPAHLVRSEYKWLQLQQQNTIPDALSMVYNELNLRIKLLGYLDKEANPQDLTLAQLRESILQPLQLLRSIYTHLNSFTLIHKIMLHSGPK